MPVTVRTIGPKEAAEGLREIFKELQDPETGFHDQWDWMNAEFFVDVLEAYLKDALKVEELP